MRKFEVWTEGYAVTGNSGNAVFYGEVEAETFDEACIKLIGINSIDKDARQADGYSRIEGRLSTWACKCFDNEPDARRAFG